VRKIVGAKIIGELRARMDKEAADKKCSLSELRLIRLIRTSLFFENLTLTIKVSTRLFSFSFVTEYCHVCFNRKKSN
jgi:hypothetical protein